MKKLKGLALLLLFASIFVTPMSIYAQEDRPEWKEKVCKNVENRTDKKIDRFDTLKDAHIRAYQNMKDRIQKFVNRLEEKGYDVSRLKEDLKTLDNKIKKFAADYALFIAELRETQTFPCGKSEGKFMEELNEARRLLRIVHEDAKDIRNYYRNVIIPDLKEINNQTPSPAPTS